MRVGSNVKSDNFTAYDTPITHTHIIVQWRESILCVATACLYAHAEYPQAIPSGKVEPISPGQDPDFDKQHADTHRGMRWPHWFSSLDNLCVCVCVWSVCLSYEIVTFFLLYPALTKCAVKLTLFVQFRWKLVWMCMNGSSPLRYHKTNHYVNRHRKPWAADALRTRRGSYFRGHIKINVLITTNVWSVYQCVQYYYYIMFIFYI